MRVTDIYLPNVLEEETNRTIAWAIIEILQSVAQPK